MSTDRDVTRVVRSWLSEDRHEDADRVLNTVLDQLDTTPQRRTLWSAWRNSYMNRILGFGLAAAAVIVIAIIGIQLLGGPNVGGPGPVDTPSPSPSPAAAETPACPTTSEGPLEPGPFAFWDDAVSGVGVTVTIPSACWYGEPRVGILVKNDNSDAPDGAGMIVFTGDLFVYADPCQWSGTEPDSPATTVDELVAALAAQASRDASEPVDITLNGYAGKSITLHVPDDAVFSECDQDTFGSWTVSIDGAPGLDPYRYHQDPGQIDEVWILDVDGVLTVIDTAHYEGTPAEDVAELRAIVESATFE